LKLLNFFRKALFMHPDQSYVQTSKWAAVLKLKAAFILLSAITLSACGSGSSAPSAGDLVDFRAVENPSGLTGSRTSTLKIKYKMPAVGGELTDANTLLFLPGGNAPVGGWPLAAWAHGTTGVADACAPSRDFAKFGDVATVNALVEAGFAVVAPDYEGLDAAGIHPYFNRASHAQSILQAVKVAAEFPLLNISKRWVVVGHSQGGHAALSAAQFASDLGPGYDLKGAVAFAPGSDLAASTDAIFAKIDSLALTGDIEGAASVQFQLSFNAGFVALGLEAMSPSISAKTLVGAQISPLLEVAKNDSDCGQFASAIFTSLKSYLKTGADVRNFGSTPRDWYKNPSVQTVLQANKIGEVRLGMQVLIIQGTDDLQVPASVTDTLIKTMQSRGSNVSRIDVPSGDHNSIVADKFPDAITFLKARL
jgi:pimeloyl-ACP methyl ester carboxylesterase